MSIAANLAPRSKRLSLRLADLGVAIPPRVTMFLDGPEVAALDGALAWGIAEIDSDSKLKLRWASGRLPDLLDVAVESGHAEPTRYLPIATIGTTHMFAVDTADPQLAVYTWEADAGFKKWADDFDSFTRKLRKRGEKSPSEKLETALETAREHDQTANHAGILAVLTPAIAGFPTSLGDNDDGRDELGEAYLLLGNAWRAKDLAKARACYATGFELGNDHAGLHQCSLLLAAGDYEQLVTVAEKQATRIYRGGDERNWFEAHTYLGRGYLLTDRPRLATRTYHQISSLAEDHPDYIRDAVAELRELRNHSKSDRDTIEAILGWLDVPPPTLPTEQLAALRAWWPALPEAVRSAITENLTLADEAHPTDDELARISRITELTVTEASLTDVSWVTQLDRLNDLDLTENELNDLSPIARLPVLTRLDLSNNTITTLRGLAACTRLERLVVDENPLNGLEGLEGMHALEEFHACSAGIESVEPLRGLRNLAEVTVYENRIADISPLAECPRLKELSCFTNPITSGLAALGTLPRLESIDAGDDSTAEDVKALRAANPFVAIDQWSPENPADSVDLVHAPDPTAREWWNALPKVWKKALIDNEIYTSKKEPDDDDLQGLLRDDSISIEDVPLLTLEPMRKLARLDYLNVQNTSIVDLSPIAHAPRLRDLIVRDNKIDLVSLAPAEKLEELYMDRCGVSSLIGLERCRALRELHAEDNHVDDLRPLAELLELRVLDLEGNQVSSLAPLARLTELHTLGLGLTRITDLAPLIGCVQLRELEVWGTPSLANALVLADLPGLARVISHGSIPKADIAELRRRKPHLMID